MENTSSSLLESLPRAALIFLLLLFQASSAHAAKSSSKVPVLTQSNDWLYRGSEPEEKDFSKIKEKGIRTVIDFRDNRKEVEWEKKKLEALRINYFNLPWLITRSVKPQLLDQFFKILDDPQNRPALIHCEHGRDRTGVMTTLALMRYEGLSEEEARETALETIRPHWHYRIFVNRKINDFIKARPDAFQKKVEPPSITEDQKQLMEWAKEARRRALQETTASG